ncbi:polysaccharide biosynthesis/export family protein [Nitrospirillum iridis]|uniref:Protein involved in polysaccharide export with SLBB domain n=1 Tax=Nitrospirillum iridis TaxID=765888 RepID=A0A7X0EG20_9PROT|nr:polysaccharide biosynthesis/export family protein [Nitrospirillum iridis]MBB6253666.1 protein involved in polysaccharide export with SLBB domain [Nitrospirillum iridis]
MKRNASFGLVLLAAGALTPLTACVPNSIQPPDDKTSVSQVGTPRTGSQAAAFTPWAEDEGDYRIGQGDEVEVKLPFNGEFNDRVTVGPDGQFTLPLVGSVHAEGRTVADITTELNQRFGRDLRDPRAQVAIRAYASQRVFVGGEVNNAGLFSMPGRIGVLEAIAMANGFMETAQSHKVVLIRRAPNGHPMMKIIDIGGFVGGTADDVRLHPFDIVFVPKTSIAEVDQWVDQFITRVVPFQRSFNYTVGRQQNFQ